MRITCLLFILYHLPHKIIHNLYIRFGVKPFSMWHCWPDKGGSDAQHHRASLHAWIAIIKHIPHDPRVRGHYRASPCCRNPKGKDGFAAQELTDARAQNFTSICLPEERDRERSGMTLVRTSQSLTLPHSLMLKLQIWLSVIHNHTIQRHLEKDVFPFESSIFFPHHCCT